MAEPSNTEDLEKEGARGHTMKLRDRGALRTPKPFNLLSDKPSTEDNRSRSRGRRGPGRPRGSSRRPQTEPPRVPRKEIVDRSPEVSDPPPTGRRVEVDSDISWNVPKIPEMKRSHLNPVGSAVVGGLASSDTDNASNHRKIPKSIRKRGRFRTGVRTFAPL